MKEKIIEIKNLWTSYEGRNIHENISFNIYKQDIFAILGGSGSGKSTLLNTIIFLKSPDRGEIKILGENVLTLSPKQVLDLKLQLGILFQFGALYSSLSVLENITIALREYTHFPLKMIEEIARMWIYRVGLKQEVAELYPSELSGGMVKRVGLARALAMSPKILFLDEPTSGLDPKSARQFDDLIAELRDLLGISVVMVTHDMDSVKGIVNRFIVIKDKQIFFEGSLEELKGQVESLDLFLYQI
ncbi:MAG: ATP-binding cassette domain-containing protein [Helicobacter sp.]|nr:ATP-binding cassette domain-containing protein [Helicobacter sp.]